MRWWQPGRWSNVEALWCHWILPLIRNPDAVAEIAFDEYNQQGCSLEPDPDDAAPTERDRV
jgi:hypothetical protein